MEIKCPKCSAVLKAPAEAVGKKAKCPKCGDRFNIQVPPPSEDPPLELQLQQSEPPQPIEAASRPRAEEPLFSPKDAPAGGNVLLARTTTGSLLQKAYMFDVLTLGGAVLLIVAGFLPWASFKMGPFERSATGLEIGWRGVIPFLSGIGAAVMLFITFYSGKVARVICIGSLGCGVVGAIITFVCLADTPSAMRGLGIYTSLLGGLGVAVANAAVLMKDKGWAKFFVKKLK